MIIRLCGSLRFWTQKAETYEKLLSSCSATWPTVNNMLLSPTASAALAFCWIQNKIWIGLFDLRNAPPYLSSQKSPYIPPCCMRSSSKGFVAGPCCGTVMGSHAFHFSAPKERNRLTLFIAQNHFLQKAAQNSLFFLGFQALRYQAASLLLAAVYLHLRFLFLTWPCYQFKKINKQIDKDRIVDIG